MVVYTGIFVKKSITAKAILSMKISHPHLTLAYMPDKSVIEKLKPYLGYSFRMTVSGYGCDGENEGYLRSNDLSLLIGATIRIIHFSKRSTL